MSDDDLTPLLDAWPYRSGRINARRITGHDGSPKIQVRLEMGVLQMEAAGRPDGEHPHDCESWLEYHLERLARSARERAGHPAVTLSPEECRALREEAVLYYHRYVALFALGDYDGVVRDTSRNLHAFDLCRQHAATEEDRAVLEQFRPSLIMMRTRAEAELAVKHRDTRRALMAIDRGLAELRSVFEAAGLGEAFDRSNEVQLLRGMRDALVPKLPASQRGELQERLQAALDAENYELAAILRDELKMMAD